MNQEQNLDYAAVGEALDACHAVCEAAEAHGVLCGMWCARAELSITAWLDELGASCEGTAGALVLQTLFEASSAALREGGYTFSPMLPDDSRPLVERLDAFRDWCEGFYLGLTVGGVTDIEKLPPDSREFLADLVEFAQLETEEQDSSEALEKDFMELNEYLRVGVMLVREELASR